MRVRLLPAVLAGLLVGLVAGGPVLAVLAGGLGPAFNTVKKTVVVEPGRDYLPANYTHILNMVFYFGDPEEYGSRESSVATLPDGRGGSWVVAYNQHARRVALARLDPVTLSGGVRLVFHQSLEAAGAAVDHAWNGKSRVLGVAELEGGSVVVATMLPLEDKAYATVYDERGAVQARQGGLVLLTRLGPRGGEAYYLDLGCLARRPWRYEGLAYFFSGIDSPFNYARASVNGSTLRLAQVSLGWPGVKARGEWLDYVYGEARELGWESSWDVNGTPSARVTGVSVAEVDLDGMTVKGAAFVYSLEHNVTALGAPLSDGGYLLYLVGPGSGLVVKLDPDMNVSWATLLSMATVDASIPPKAYNYWMDIAETRDGYAILTLSYHTPVLILLGRDGKLEWAARLQASPNMVYWNALRARMTAWNDTIYVVVTGGFDVDGRVRTLSWITMFTEEGEVLGSFRNPERATLNVDLFDHAEGRLGRDTTLLYRTRGYDATGGRRAEGYMDLAYLLPDYREAELGYTSPFRDFRSNEEDLRDGYGWLVSREPEWLNATTGYEGAVEVARYRSPLLIESGESTAIGSYTVNYTGVETEVYDPGSVEFIPSFYYPVAIMPESVDFGEVHVGERVEVEMEVILLTQSPGTARAVMWHWPSADDPSFKIENLDEFTREWLDRDGVDVGERVRIRLSFTPSEAGTHSAVFGLGIIPEGAHTSDPLFFDYPRQVIPLRGYAAPEDEPITSGDYPISLGVSVVDVVAPPHVIPGSTYRQSLYITNVGTAEAVFLYIGYALAGNTVLDVKGVDELLGLYPDNGSAAVFAFTLRLKPGETRRVDVVLQVDRRIADPNHPFSILRSEDVPHGAMVGEAASLPPGLWRSLYEEYAGEDPQRVIIPAMNASAAYLDEQIIKFFTSGSEDEVLDNLYRIGVERPELYSLIVYTVLRKTVISDDWLFTKNGTAEINLSSPPESIKVPVMVKVPGNTSNRTTTPLAATLSQPLRLEGGYSSGLEYALDHPLETIADFLNPVEFTKTAWEGLKGFGKGSLKALSMGFVDLKADNDYQFAGKVIGEVATNIELILADVGGPKLVQQLGLKLEAAGSKIAESLLALTKRLAGTGATASDFALTLESAKVAIVSRLGGKFPIKFGLEAVKTFEGKPAVGTLVKWAFNEKFAEQGWYLGLGYVKANPTFIKDAGKYVYKTFLHFYPRAWKIAVWSAKQGRYVEIDLWRHFMAGLKYVRGANIVNIWRYTNSLTRLAGSHLSSVSFSADPNYLALDPHGYTRSLQENVTATVHFENLPEATAPAYNVTVKLYLEGPVDEDSITVWGTDHPEAFSGYTVERGSSLTVVTVNFTNITLPPNKNPPEGEGLVEVVFNLEEGAPAGSAVRAYADVYFDYNPPVRTNEEVLVYDPTPPNLSLDARAEDGTVYIDVDASDDVSTIEEVTLTVISPHGVLGPINATAKDSIIMSLGPGNYTIVAEAYDTAGNNAVAEANVTVEAPQTTTTSPPRTPTTTETQTGPTATPAARTQAPTTTAAAGTTGTEQAPAQRGVTPILLAAAAAAAMLGLLVVVKLRMRARR